MEAPVKDAVLARVLATQPPRTASCAEGDVVGDVGGEDALGDQPRGANAEMVQSLRESQGIIASLSVTVTEIGRRRGTESAAHARVLDRFFFLKKKVKCSFRFFRRHGISVITNSRSTREFTKHGRGSSHTLGLPGSL